MSLNYLNIKFIFLNFFDDGIIFIQLKKMEKALQGLY